MPVMQNAGQSQAVQEAMKRRVDDGLMNQTSDQARMQQDVPQPTPPSQVGSMPMTPGSMEGMPPAQPPQKFTPQNSNDMIIMALIEQLKNDGQLKKQSQKMGMGGGMMLPNQLPER